MAHIEATIETARYAVAIKGGRHEIVSDEPASHGGKDAGLAPYDLLLASLASCTAITLRMYADRKQWDVSAIHVDLLYLRETEGERIERKLHLEGELSDEQRVRMADIAERTPVTLTLKRALPIHTRMDPPLAAELQKEKIEDRLDEALDESFPASDPPAFTP